MDIVDERIALLKSKNENGEFSNIIAIFEIINRQADEMDALKARIETLEKRLA